MKKTIITISREYGSGGREIGRKLASKLGIPFYDNELITIAAKKSGFAEEMFQQADLKPTGSLLYTLSLFGGGGAGFDLPLSDKIYLIQSDIIKEVAAQGSCVIVGRCADYVLRENPSLIRIFVHADLQSRIERSIRVNELNEDKAKEKLLRIDKRRSSYYNYYTNQRWGRAEHFDLSINSAKLGVDGAVEVLETYTRATNRESAETL